MARNIIHRKSSPGMHPASYVSSSSAPLNFSSSGPCLVQIFIPSLYPLVPGNPACIVAGSPNPSSSKFCQNTAFPGTGLNVTPLSQGSSQSKNSHHRSSCGASSMGKLVPPPVKLLAATYTKKDVRRLPPMSGVMRSGALNQSVCKWYRSSFPYWTSWRGSKWERGMSKPWKRRARDSIQWTIGSLATEVDCDVLVWRRPSWPDSSATADCLNVPFLREVSYCKEGEVKLLDSTYVTS